MDRDDLLEMIKPQPNGLYTVQVCANCKYYYTRPDGDYRKAKITRCCKECYTEYYGSTKNLLKELWYKIIRKDKVK